MLFVLRAKRRDMCAATLNGTTDNHIRITNANGEKIFHSEIKMNGVKRPQHCERRFAELICVLVDRFNIPVFTIAFLI